MAARVNTRFVILISAVLVGLVASAAATYFVLLKASPDELVARGDAYLAQAQQLAQDVNTKQGKEAEEAYARAGEAYLFAAEMFGKAFDARRTDVDSLVKYIDALSHIHVETAPDAQRILQEQDAKLQLATQISDRQDLLERYYDNILRQTLWGGNEDAVNAILGRLDTAVNAKLDTDRDNATALKYRGIVRTLRLSPRTSDLSEYAPALGDLDRAAAALPDDAMIPMFRAKWLIAEANRLRQPNEGTDLVPNFDNIGQAVRPISAEMKALVDEAVAHSRVTLEKYGQDDLEVRFRHIENLFAFPVFRPREPESEEATLAIVDEVREIVDGIRDDLLQDPSNMDAVLRVGDLMTRLDREVIKYEDRRGQTTNGIQRTEELLRAVAAAQPFNVIYRVYLGNLLKLQMDLEEALLAYKEANDIIAVGPAEMVLRELHFKRLARLEIANIELIQAENETDPAVREAALVRAEQAIVDLDQVLPGKAPVYLLRGKVAMLRGNNTLAMKELDAAVESFQSNGDFNVEAMLLSARARQQERQWGAAADRLERVLNLQQIRGNPESEDRLRSQLAEIYINSDRRAEAREQIDRILEIGINPRVAQMLDAGLMLREGQVDEALAIYRELDMLSQPATMRNVARELRRAGRLADAAELLEIALAANPAELMLIGELMLSLEGDVTERRAQIGEYLDAALAAGAPEGSVVALRASITPVDAANTQAQQAELVKWMRESAGDPVDAELREASLWERMGDETKARSAFRRAEALNADHPQVILMGIQYASRDKDQRKLDALAERAARKNIDLADGDFVRGQIASSQNNLTAAIAHYRSGLAKRAVYDEGWKALGDLYMRVSQVSVNDNRYDDAADAYQVAVNQKPDNVGALVGLSIANRQRGRNTAAVDAMRQAVRHAPDNPQILQAYLQTETEIGDPARALQMQQEIAGRNPDNFEAQINMVRLLASERVRRYGEALAALDATEARLGQSLRTVSVRADVALAQGDAARGRAVIDAYLADRGDQATAEDHLTLARYLNRIEQPEAALASYESAAALETDPVRPIARELADRYFTLGRFAEAAMRYAALREDSSVDDADRGRLAMRIAETQLRLGDVPAAEAALQGLPDDAQTLVLRALIARQNQDAAAAEGFLTRAIELDNLYALAYLQRGLIRASENAQGALADAVKAIELDPQLAAARQLRARLLMNGGDVDQAIDAFSSVLAGDPRDSESRIALIEMYVRQGDLQTAQITLSDGQRWDANNPAWKQLQARIALAGGDPTQIILKLEEAVGETPTPAGLQALAEAYLREKRPADALRLLDNHPAFVNQNVLLQARKGQALIATNSGDAGARLLALAMQRSANRSQLGYVTRAAAEIVGVEGAFQLLDAATRDANRELDSLLAKSMVLLDRQDYSQALELLPQAERLVTAGPSSDPQTLTAIRRMSALCYYNSGQFEQAEQAYRRLLETNPEDVESLNNLAFLLGKQLGRPAEALPLIQRAVDLTEPDSASILDTLGIVQFMNGQVDQARETLENALLLNRDLAPLHLHLAEVYRAQNLATKAAQSAQEALRLAQNIGDRETESQARKLLEQ